MHLATSPRGLLNYGNPVNRQAPLNRGLVSWWMNLPQRRGGTRFLDLCGRHHGTLTNGPTWGGPLNPGGWGSLVFTSGKYVSIPDAASLDLTVNWTVSYWYTRVGSGTTPCIAKYVTAGENRSFWLESSQNTVMRASFSSDGTSAALATYSFSTSNDLGSTYHVTFSKTGSDLTCYKNGVSLGTQTVIDPFAGTAPFEIGGSSVLGTTSNRMDGVGVWSRGLSASEASALYQASRQGYGLELSYSNRPFIFDMGGGAAPADEAPAGVGLAAINVPGADTLQHGNPVNQKATLNRKLACWLLPIAQRTSSHKQFPLLTGGYALSSGTATAPSLTSGPPGQRLAYRFDGTDDHLSSSIFAGSPSSSSFWIRPNGQTEDFGGILTNSTTRGLFYRGSAAGADAGKLDWVHNGSSHLSTAALTDQAWTHVTVTFDGTNFLIYLNGLLDTTVAGAGTTFGGFGSVDGTSNFFKGDLTDIRIANRLLSADEAQHLYAVSRTGYRKELIYRRPIWPVGGSEVPVGSGAITGSSTLTFAANSTLTGDGALSGASTLSFSPTSTLTADGALSGSSSLTFGSTSTLIGAGALSGSATLTFEASGSFGTVVYIVDDLDAGFSTAGGGWTTAAGQGYASQVTFAPPLSPGPPGTGSNTARWTLTGLTAGDTVDVAWTWSPMANRATNTPWTIYDSDGTTVLASGTQNQENAPNDFSDAGADWENADTVVISGTEISFEITDDADEFVIADAVRFEVTSAIIGSLSGSSSITFSPSSTLLGSGALAGSSSLSFSPTSTPSGLGSLTGSSSVTFDPTSTLTGLGALTGSSSITFVGTGSFDGTAALSGSSTLTFSSSASLTGLGSLSGSSSLEFSPSSALSGTGALSGSSTLTFSISTTLSGIGALTGSSTITFVLAGTLGDANEPDEITYAQLQWTATPDLLDFTAPISTLDFTANS
jgi:hypothetical protein